MDTPIRKLFDPAVMPPRDEDGMCCHPDLLTDRWNMDDNDEAYDRAKFAEAGFEVTFVWFETDAPAEQVDRYAEIGDPDVSYWTPTPPGGEGWMLCGIWDTEDMPVAFYVRERVPA